MCVLQRAGDGLLRTHTSIYLHTDEADNAERGGDPVRSANHRAC